MCAKARDSSRAFDFSVVCSSCVFLASPDKIMDPTECRLDEQGKPHCSVCGGKAIETSRHLSHIDMRSGTPVSIDRVWGRCQECNATGWWRTEPGPSEWFKAQRGSTPARRTARKPRR
jgi:hypothetical protein